MPEYRLVIVDGPDQGKEFSVSGATVIGRDPSAGIVLSDSETSRRHVTVLVQDDRVMVEDLGSTNGSFLNGQRIEAAHGMVEGDKLRIGRSVMELKVAEAGAAPAADDAPDLQATAMRSVPTGPPEPTEELPSTLDPPPPSAPPPPAPAPAPAASAPPPPAPPAPPPAPPPAAPPGGPGPQSPGPQAPFGGGPPSPPPSPGGLPPVGGPPSPPPSPGGFPPVGGPQAPPPGAPGGGFGPPPGGPPAYGGLQPQTFGGGPIPQHALASWGSRLAAVIIDGLILMVPFAILYFGIFAAIGIGASADDGSGAGIGAAIAAIFFSMLAFLAVALVYAPYFMKRPGERNGQTLGKQAMNIRVVKTDGQPITFGFAAVREVAVKIFLVGIVNSFTFGLASLLDGLWPLWDDQNRALHDMVVNTRVIKA